MDQVETRRIVNVRVKNGNEQEFSDAFNGRTYSFPAKQTVSIPLEAAVHIFGYQMKRGDTQQMFEHVCKRWGWNTPKNVAEKFAAVYEIWSKFEFVPVAVKMVEQPVIDTGALAEARDDTDHEEDEDKGTDLTLGEPTIKSGKKNAAA